MPNHGRVVAFVAAGVCAGCGASHHASLRIYGEGGIGPVLSRVDLRSARAGVDPKDSRPDVLLELTPNGQKKLLELMRNAIRASRRRRRAVHILISANGKVIDKRSVDYRTFGNPLPAPSGIVIDVPSAGRGRDLAARLNP